MSTLAPFANEPVLELRRAPVRAQLEDAMTRLLPTAAAARAGDDRRPTSDTGAELLSTDPGEPERVVAVATRGSERDVAAAVDEAERGSARLARASAPPTAPRR